MKIPDIFKSGERSLSFEFFPPKTEDGIESLFRAIGRLKAYQPTHVSVTYGAGGSTRETTVGIVTRIKQETGLEPMCHVTCVAQTRDQVHDVLVRLERSGIENILGLRGDPPRGETEFVPEEGGFEYAADLIAYTRKTFPFGIGGACFPEGHVDSPDLETDVVYLKKKVDAGADFLVTQLFFDNADFFHLQERMERAGIKVPVVAGILPILSTPQIRRFTSYCGAQIPPSLDAELEKYVEDDQAARELGIDYATRQIEELWRNGVAGIHLYSLNRSYSASKILDSLDLDRD